MSDKTTGQKLMETLSYNKKNFFEISSEEEIRKMYDYAEGYKAFLNNAKTEREAVDYTIALAEAKGYKPYKLGDKLAKGDKRYYNNRGKSLALFRIGTEPLETDGIRILAAHIDAPRIDIKQNPIYESDGMCFLKTHYYGGIKKYQWTAIPLALHGAIVKKDGTKVEIKIGEDAGDPVFYINDLLPHLSREQYKKTLGEAIGGEDLNIVIGGLPYPDKEVKDKIKLNVLKILNEKYGLVEEDMLSAELSAVPAFKACDIGFDRALIGSYGHDDRVCSYPSVTALFENESKKHTVLTILADKEEIGSEGNTGMQSRIYEDIINSICRAFDACPAVVRSVSKCLSSDVTACYDPNFAGVYEKNNAAMLSCGTAMCKFTGAGGKSGSNDASAEFVAEVRRMFAEENVCWQTSELGRVDAGGGGTVAKFIANMNIDTVDIGVPVISMHAPFEMVSKADVYSSHKAFLAFIK